MAEEDQTKVDVKHDGKDTQINILHKDGEEEKESNMADSTLNLNLDKVVVKSANAYVELPDGTLKGLESGVSRIDNVGDGRLAVTLPCGDEVVFDAETVISALVKATDLPVAE